MAFSLPTLLKIILLKVIFGLMDFEPKNRTGSSSHQYQYATIGAFFIPLLDLAGTSSPFKGNYLALPRSNYQQVERLMPPLITSAT